MTQRWIRQVESSVEHSGPVERFGVDDPRTMHREQRTARLGGTPQMGSMGRGKLLPGLDSSSPRKRVMSALSERCAGWVLQVAQPVGVAPQHRANPVADDLADPVDLSGTVLFMLLVGIEYYGRLEACREHGNR